MGFGEKNSVIGGECSKTIFSEMLLQIILNDSLPSYNNQLLPPLHEIGDPQRT